MVITPSSYFIVTGKGESNVSEIVSFDNALIDAGIADYNWVPVSSILPSDIHFDKTCRMPKKGSVMFCVMSRAMAKKGKIVTVGIGAMTTVDIEGNRSVGFVMEGSVPGEDKNYLVSKIKKSLNSMAKLRRVKPLEENIVAITLKPSKMFGTAIAVVVFNNYEIAEF